MGSAEWEMVENVSFIPSVWAESVRLAWNRTSSCGRNFSSRPVKCFRPIAIFHVRAKSFFSIKIDKFLPRSLVLNKLITRSFFLVHSWKCIHLGCMNSKLPQRCVSSLSRKTKVLDWSEPAWLLWTLCEVASTREDWCRDSEFSFPLVFSKMRVYDWVYLAEHRALLEINFSRFLWYKNFRCANWNCIREFNWIN